MGKYLFDKLEEAVKKYKFEFDSIYSTVNDILLQDDNNKANNKEAVISRGIVIDDEIAL